MGQSTNGMLVYGYDLGSAEDDWNVREVGEYGGLNVPWWNDENEDGDFQGAAERRLLAEIAGFTEEWAKGNEGYFKRENAAKAQLGVKVDTYCSGEYPMYLLATKVITVYRGSVEGIDMADLVQAPEREGWDEKLRIALAALGLTPKQERAKWLLVSYSG